MVHYESKDIAVFSARPAPIVLKLRIDVEGGAVIVMERTQAFEFLAGRVQGDICADDVDNVVGFLDPLGQASPIVRQKTPVGRKESIGPSPWPDVAVNSRFFESVQGEASSGRSTEKNQSEESSRQKVCASPVSTWYRRPSAGIRVQPCSAYLPASWRRPKACRKSNRITDFHHCGASLKKL